ncbi:MAG: bifunctional acetate--CoA ligase family protein/GNAT family N-acetyltransferase [Rhodobacteraceae bacterium]|nr:bifunctional acetate--CoA ligase family protein/GNAT family N-acetyltransferase [Paracoccaceae bacterium]
MTQRNLDALFNPNAVAVIGAGRNPQSLGHVLLRNIAADFSGRLGVVHPQAPEIGGVPASATVAGLPFVPDLAVVTTPPDAVPGVIAELGAKGTRAAVVITAGFGEGGRGSDVRAAMLNAAKPHLVRILGPNCLGILIPRCGLNASFARVSARNGGLAVAAQSGAVAATMLDWAAPRGIGFSAMASLGDMADIDFGDVLDYLAGDSDTKAILLYIEAVTNPRKFMSAARAAARLKPVIVIKSGRHAESAKAAASHTGALAGSDAVYDAAFARAGLMRVDTMDQLFDAAELLSATHVPRGDNLAIVSNGGGIGVMAADALIGGGGKLASLSPKTLAALDGVLPKTWSRANPVDIIGDANGERYERALTAVLTEPSAHAALVLYCPTAVSDPDDTAAKTIAAARSATMPVLTAWVGDASVEGARAAFTAARVPTFRSAEEAVGAVNLLNVYRRRRDMLMQVPPPARLPDDAARTNVARVLAAAEHASGGWVRGHEAKQIAREYGIATNQSIFCASAQDAGAAASRIGGRCALKIVSPQIIHKSDVGGVVLDLDGPQAVEIAARAMADRVRERRPDADITGFLVEEMIDRKVGHELILGMTVDKTFGPVIVFGQGGTAVEVINDKVLGLPPLDMALAAQMIAETRVGRLLAGYRDQAPIDRDTLARNIVALSALITDHPNIVDLDINPLFASHTGLVALDVRIRIDPSSPTTPVISPYPAHLARNVCLTDRTAMSVRPIRPDDENALRDMMSHLSPEDVRFRFFAPLHAFDHAMAARLTQIDYDREIAFVAAPANAPDEFWGVARLHAEPDGQRAEYAIAVRSDRKGRGLGTTLMEVLLDEAARRGIGEVWGDVLAENTRMLTLANELGFKRASGADATVVRTVKTLKA